MGFLVPLVLYMVLLYAVPLYENVSMSFHRYTRATFVTGKAPFVGLDVYREVISSPQFLPILGHTVFFVVVSLFFQYTIGLALAVFFQRNFPLSPVLRALFLVPWLLPIIVSATTWQWMFDADSGVINRLLGLVGIDPVWWLSADHSLVSVTIANIWLGIPFNLVILYAGLQNIPTELYEAAAVDGATGWRQFRSITFPLLRPVTAITLLLGFVYTLKVVDIIWIMTFGTGFVPDHGDVGLRDGLRQRVLGRHQVLGGVRRRHFAAAHRPRDGLRLHLCPTQAGVVLMTGGRRAPWKTALGVVLTAIMLFPLYWMINVSLTRREAIRDADFFPRAFTFHNYGEALSDQLPYLGTSVLVGLGTVVVTLLVAAPAAYALAHLFVPGRRGLSFLLIVAQMIPAVVMSLGFYQLYSNLGTLDTIPGLIIADSTLAVPFAVLLFEAFMLGIPRELLQAASIDGASYWRTFRSIVLPISRNAAVTVALFAFLWSWSDFLFASTLNRGGGRLRPITMGIYDYIGAQNQEWGPMMATAVLASIPTALLIVVAQRYVSAGITAGAVKD